MKLLTRYCSLLAASFLSGCATYHPAPLDSTEILNLLDDRSPARLVDHPSSQEDRKSFDPSDGLSEAELIAIALRLNTSLAIERSKLGEAESQLIAAGIFPNPELSGNIKPGLSKTNGVNADIDLMFELTRLGERDAKNRVASAAQLAARAGLAVKEYQIATEVRLQLTAVLAAEQELELLNQELQLRQKSLELITRRRDAGDANTLDIAASEMELADIQRDQRDAARHLSQERIKLNRLLGLPAQSSLNLSDSNKPIEVQLITPPTDDALRNQLIAARFDLRLMEAEYKQAEEELRLEVIRQYPSLKIGPSFSHEGSSDNYLGLAIAMDLPLLNRNRGPIAAKLAQRDRVRAEYIDLLHQLTIDAAAEAELVRDLRRDVNLHRQQVLPQMERNAKLFRAALDAREMNIIDFVTVQGRSLQGRRAYLKLLIEYRTAMIRLDAAAGMHFSGLSQTSTTQSSTMQIKETP